MKENRQIPPAFRKFFWDADFTKLKFPEHENYVLGKLMAYGDLASIHWIIRAFDHGTISRYLEKKERMRSIERVIFFGRKSYEWKICGIRCLTPFD